MSAASQVNAQASPSAYTTGLRYDAMHRLVGTISPDPDGSGPLLYAATRNTYDGVGRLIKIQKGELSAWQSETVAPSAWPTTAFTILQTTNIAYDSQSRKIQESLVSSGVARTVTQYSYDAQGNLQCTAVRMNPSGTLPSSACSQTTPPPADGPDQITENIYDAADQLIQVRKGVGVQGLDHAEATYSYTSTGKREFTIDGDGNKAQFTYDGHDRQQCWIFPSKTPPSAYNDSSQSTALSSAGAVSGDCVTSGDYESYAYDLNGNRTSLRNRRAQTISYTYDNLNRMTHKGGSAVANVDYTYDAEGHQLTSTFSTGGAGTTNTYTGFGELKSSSSTSGGPALALSYLYDADGNRSRLTFPDGNFFTYSYDGLDRETGILQAGTTSLLSITFDQLGRRNSLARTGAGKTTYAYDVASRLQSLTDQLGTAPGANDLGLTFTYYASDQIKTKASSNSSYSWTGAASTNRPYTINGLNQYTAAGATTFAYDASGNLTQSGSNFFCYDAENRLLGEGASSTDCSSLAQLTYDPLGRLVTTEAGGTTTRLVYDGDDLVAEYNSAGTLLRRYLHGPSTDDPLVQYEGATVASTVERNLYSDAQGSIIAATDNAGNLMAGSIDKYDEYGIPQTDSAGHSLNSGRFQYTGQQWIPEVGMYYFKARFLSPTLGRFMQTDPVGYDGGINIYEYADDDPVDHDDPSGNCPQDTNCMTPGNQTPLPKREPQASVSGSGAIIAGLPSGRGVGVSGSVGVGLSLGPLNGKSTISVQGQLAGGVKAGGAFAGAGPGLGLSYGLPPKAGASGSLTSHAEVDAGGPAASGSVGLDRSGHGPLSVSASGAGRLGSVGPGGLGSFVGKAASGTLAVKVPTIDIVKAAVYLVAHIWVP